MNQNSKRCLAALLLIGFGIFGTQAFAAQKIVSTMRNVQSVYETNGYFVAPDFDTPAIIIQGDEAPAQRLEVIRPNDAAVSFGRIFTSCSCIQLESPSRTYAMGERAIFTLRNVKPTPSAGQTYAVYIQVTSPIRTTLRYDIFVQSERFMAQTPVGVNELPNPSELETSFQDIGQDAVVVDESPSQP